MLMSPESIVKMDKSKNRFLIDWFSFSSRVDSFDTFASLLGLSSVKWKIDSGVRGYSERYSFQGITIHYAGYGGSRFSGTSQEQQVKGAWLEMSGQGCRTYETYGLGDWQRLIDYVNFNIDNITVNRVDIAYDDFLGYLDIDKIFEDALNLRFVSRQRNVFTVTSIDTETKELGKTIAHGKEGSDTYIRIYDKRVEQNAVEILDHWVRCELQLRHKNAAAAIGLLSDEFEIDSKTNKLIKVSDRKPIGELYFLILNNYLRYIEPSETDSNRWRAPMAEHWKKFAESVTNQRISLWSSPGIDYSLSRLSNYVINTSGSAIYTYITLFGVDTLVNFVQEKMHILAPKYKLLLDYKDDLSGGEIFV